MSVAGIRVKSLRITNQMQQGQSIKEFIGRTSFDKWSSTEIRLLMRGKKTILAVRHSSGNGEHNFQIINFCLIIFETCFFSHCVTAYKLFHQKWNVNNLVNKLPFSCHDAYGKDVTMHMLFGHLLLDILVRR